MVQGNLVYQGTCSDSIQYFKNIGYPIPIRTNPTDFYMKIMNKEGVALDYIGKGIEDVPDNQIISEFEQRVTYFKSSYKDLNLSFVPTVHEQLLSSETQGNLPWCAQMGYIFVRAVWNELRNPLDVQMKVFGNIIQAIFCVILYYQEGSTAYGQIQNVSGALFFMLMNAGFGAISGALNAFSM